jgi:hypothetical protein
MLCVRADPDKLVVGNNLYRLVLVDLSLCSHQELCLLSSHCVRGGGGYCLNCSAVSRSQADMHHLPLHGLHSVVANRTVVAYLMVVATVRGPGRPEQARDRAATGREEAHRPPSQGTVCSLLCCCCVVLSII